MIKAWGISEFGVWERLCFVEFYDTCSDARGRFLAMSKIDEYRANAAECHRMARTARDAKDRQTWQGMAASWSRLAEQKCAGKVEQPRD